MDEILEQFLSEARDNLDYLDSHLKELDGGDEETINSLFRAAHTLKGGAGLVGLTYIKEITHAAEDLLDAFRNKEIKYSDEMLNTLYDAFDEVIELIDAVEENGDMNVEVDEANIENIKKEIRAFLDVPTNDENPPLNLPFILDENIYLDNLTNNQLKIVLPHIYENLDINTDFIENQNYWILDLNLDEYTISFGNDPFYLISMLENENILVVSTEVYNPDDLSDPLALKTRLKVVCKTDVETIEDIFYNVIDEVRGYPLTIKSLIETDKDSIENDTFTTLMNDIKNNGFSGLSHKFKVALNVINPDTKEGFLVDRILNISNLDENLLPSIFENLDINIELKELDKIETDLDKQEIKDDNISQISLNEKEKETTLNILKSQKIALKTVGALERVKFVLKSVVSFLGVQKSDIENIETEEKLNNFIDKMILSLKNPEENIETEKEEMKIVEKPLLQQEDKIIEDNHSKVNENKSHNSIPKTIKIDQEEIEILMDIVGEILVVKNSLPYVAESITSQNPMAVKRELLSKYEEISRITDQLQDRVMGMRLLPVSYIFNRYPKLVRDISKKLNKKIDYQEYGSETKLDKMMIEKLADPLIHIIRNSLDHGLETPEERKEAGKPEIGILKIGARSEGDRVFIEIKDDGRGINVEKVINIALEKRLIDPDKLDIMSESDKLSLIFLPGLSTKDKITDLSGRGVGADAVKTTVTALSGKINITSKKGEGTTIILELPVSVALTNLFQIKMSNENYAISMESVIETDKILKEDIQTANHKPFIRLRDTIIPVVLNETLLKRKEFKDEENIIIVKVSDTQIALIADELVGQIDVVQKPLSGILKNHPYINGTSLLGNGEPLFVIKPETLLKVI